ERDDAPRARAVAEVVAKAVASGTSEPIVEAIASNYAAREPSDKLRAKHTKIMERLAETLPVYLWIKSICGAGALGLATIVALAGDLSRYPDKGCLWKMLGFAPYEGLAGSTWKREKWRPRKLTNEEWKEN